ncbi:MAG: iron ABC transporter permease [Gammaproteobacteria bacterium]|nr:iron ABC transporter permease [Gammaproteobacteria bacterium]
MITKLRRHAVLPVLIVLTTLMVLALLISMMTGSTPIPLTDLLYALSGNPSNNLAHTVMWELRLPRALSALLTGAMLALAGTLMQVLLRNPLADPYILGISGGSAFGTLAALLLGLSGALVTGSAFAGALLSMLLVFALAHGPGGWTSSRLLLTGIIIASGWGALLSLMLSLSPDQQLRGMLFWLMGDLGQGTTPSWWYPAALALALAMALFHARDLNLLSRGEDQARTLGVEVRALRYRIYFLASLLTALAVTLAGSIGFIGLVVPHMLRMVIGSDHRLLLPAATLAGGTLLVIADTLARTLFAPQQLPVGVLTALLGVPLFLWLMQRESSRQVISR